MYTRCPECQTVFRITAAQLKARAGQVRCGRCQHVFDAESHFVETPAKPAPKKRSARKSAKHPGKPAETLELPFEEHITPPESAPAQRTSADDRRTPSEPLPIPLWLLPRLRTRTFYWAAGNCLLVILLFLQGLFFFGQDIVRTAPFLETTYGVVCEFLPCRKPAPDLRRLDLIESQIAPHPHYDKALRIRATLVNRAESAQPYPLLEVSLLDNQGKLLARRAYSPKEYLVRDAAEGPGLPPQLAVNVEIDIASPGPQASGFEILLLPPPG